jgi:hypothetical protein
MRNKVVKGKRVGIIILAVAVTVALLFTACAPGPSVQEQKVVRIGTINSLTGGAASSDQLSLMGFQDYVRYFNEETGIPGWTIDVYGQMVQVQRLHLLAPTRGTWTQALQ